MPVLAAADLDGIADRLEAAIDRGIPVPPVSATDPGFDAAAAAAVRNRLHARRIAGGARPVGRKIGFTNTTIWPLYGVDRPIWAHVYDRTVHDPAPAALAVGGLAEPRIEPEVVLGLARAPEPGMDAAALAACVGWIAAGFEVVQSVYPGWRFAGADATAARGLHAALLLGPRRPARIPDDFAVTLARDGVPVAQGRAAHVLGGPLRALAHLVAALAAEPGAPPLAAGELVSTGTLTDAAPIAPGQVWTAAFAGIDLPAPVLRTV